MIAECNVQPPLNINNKHVDVTDNGTQMRYEHNRLLSFKDWPLAYMSPVVLAKAGFYYTKVQDLVRCAFCNIEIGQWDDGDDPFDDHKKYAPYCPLMSGIRCGNISMPSLLKSDSVQDTEEDTCGKYGIQHYPRAQPAQASLSKLGISPIVRPKYPSYATVEQRIRSFKLWPVAMKQKPVDMAEAGFFYTGEGDRTICFSCGNGLNFWTPEDKPFEQHARWYPNCAYLKYMKSPEFIASAAEVAKATSTGEQSEHGEASQSIPTTSSESTKAAVEEKPTKESTDEPTLCKICLTNEIGVAFMPCGHLVACKDCAPTQTNCAICRTKLTAMLKTYFT